MIQTCLVNCWCFKPLRVYEYFICLVINGSLKNSNFTQILLHLHYNQAPLSAFWFVHSFLNTLLPYKSNLPPDPIPSDMPQLILHHNHDILSMGLAKLPPLHVVLRSHWTDFILNSVVSSVLFDRVNTASNSASLMPNFSSNACPCHNVFHSLIFVGPQPAITKCH